MANLRYMRFANDTARDRLVKIAVRAYFFHDIASPGSFALAAFSRDISVSSETIPVEPYAYRVPEASEKVAEVFTPIPVSISVESNWRYRK